MVQGLEHPDADSAKLMEGIYKTGVLGPEAKPAL
jgi:hypothetical protein